MQENIVMLFLAYMKRYSICRFRVWARKNALDQVDYAKSIGAKMLKFFEEYFDVKYPLPKQVIYNPY